MSEKNVKKDSIEKYCEEADDKDQTIENKNKWAIIKKNNENWLIFYNRKYYLKHISIFLYYQ